MQKRRKSSETYIIGQFLMRQEPGRTDLEQNFSADERERGNGKRIKNNKNEENLRFSTLLSSKFHIIS